MAVENITPNIASGVQPKIKVSRNGPYLVSGNPPLSQQTIISDADGTARDWSADKKIPTRESYALCRCGQSKGKPFCDGSHARTKFNGTETASPQPFTENAEKFHGPALVLSDAEALCAGARFCQRTGGIWNLVSRSADPEAKQAAIQEAGNCPAGRLVLHDKDGQSLEPKLEPGIRLVEDPHEGVHGPLWVRGGIPLEAADGTAYEVRNRVALCRCGKSCNKPFCDGNHLDT